MDEGKFYDLNSLFLEDSNRLLEQYNLIKHSGFDSITLGIPLTKRERIVIQEAKNKNFEINFVVPFFDNAKFIETSIDEIKIYEPNSIIIKWGNYGYGNILSDPRGYQLIEKESIGNLLNFIAACEKFVLEKNIFVYPVRSTFLKPELYYHDLLMYMHKKNLNLSLDIAQLKADINNNKDKEEDILFAINKVKNNNLMPWISAIRFNKTYIPCGCEKINDYVWEFYKKNFKEFPRLIMLSDRLSSENQIKNDMRILNKIQRRVHING